MSGPSTSSIPVVPVGSVTRKSQTAAPTPTTPAREVEEEEDPRTPARPRDFAHALATLEESSGPGANETAKSRMEFMSSAADPLSGYRNGGGVSMTVSPITGLRSRDAGAGSTLDASALERHNAQQSGYQPGAKETELDWETLSTDSGALYFHNLKTGEVQWEVPDALKPQLEQAPDVEFDLPAAKPTPVRDSADARLPAVPQSTTSFPSASSFDIPPVSGNEFASDRHAAPSNEPSISSSMPADPEDDPTNWEEYVTDDGYLYYFNTVTGSTTWDKPSCLPSVRERVALGLQKSVNGTANSAVSEQPGKVFGRQGWISLLDKDGYIYYHNEITGVTQWETPPGF